MAQSLATQNGGDSNPLDTTGLCLLSLDGGGVRGLSTLCILKGLMTRLNNQRRDAGLPSVKPCEIFDLIGGTSTGGLIAIMLGRLEMDVDECITAYNRLMTAVFKEKSGWLPVSWTGRVKARFDSRKLKSVVEEVVNDKGASATDAFNDGKNRGCRTFVCSAAKETAGITRLRSYTLPDEGDIPATICEAALATSAATSFFDPVSIGARQFVDGAVGANNPVDEVEGEAANIWSSGTGDLKPLVKCFVSIGTGNPGKKAIEDDLLKFLSKNLVGIATETEETERKFIARWAKHYDEKRYFRFNVDQGLQEVGLAEYKEQGRMEAATDEYLRHQAQKFRVRDCIQNLQQKQSKTDVGFADIIKEYCIRIIQLSISSRKGCWNVPFERNPRFVGRHTQLDRLEGTVFVKDQPRKIAITGLGGIGKTQIALELAYQTRDKYPDCSIFWIPATNAESLQQAFTEIGQQLGVPGVEEEQADMKKLVQRHLTQESTGQWLLIVDNVDDMEIWNSELKGCLPKNQQGCIVCTSRTRKLALQIAPANVIEVPEMDEEMAMQLLSKSLINQKLLTRHQAARKLLEQLTFLPLAIVQAAAYINENGIALSDYLSLLEEQEQDVVELLSEDFEDDGRYPDAKNPVATTWLISFEQIQRLEPLAADYLSFISCVAPKDIPQSLLPPGPSCNKKTVAVGTLNSYSFVSKRTDDALDVHRLVQLATRSWLRDQGQWHVWADRTLTRLVEVVPLGGRDKREVWIAYLPHAIRVVGMTELWEAEGRMSLLDRIGCCERTLGRYRAAEWAHRQLLERREKVLGKDHPLMLVSMNEVARALNGQGKYAEAEKMHRETLALKEKVLGKEHPETLTSINNLALALDNQGKYAEAEKMHRERLALKEKVSGKEHPGTLTSMNNLALALGHQGKYAEAERMHRETLALREKVLGKEHPKTLTSINNLAQALGSQGKYAEAEKIHRERLALKEKVSGKEHPGTLRSMNNLAQALGNQGKYAEAEKMHRETLALREKVLGKEHPETLTSINNLAQALGSQGKYAEAEKMHRKRLALKEKVLGKEHLETLTSISGLARVLSH